ncbi:MAG: hypothetical protein HQL01_07265 [Nitrospirae bacterium]|nr:hypothetical protein [Nitrospirota bacterium]
MAVLLMPMPRQCNTLVEEKATPFLWKSLKNTFFTPAASDSVIRALSSSGMPPLARNVENLLTLSISSLSVQSRMNVVISV